MSVDISELTTSLPVEQQKAVRAEYKRRAKDSTAAFLWCFFLGIFGAHCFYLGRTGQGIFRLIISPLIIPGLIWEVVDLLRIDHEVHARNLKLAEQLVAQAMLGVPNSKALAEALDKIEATRPQEQESAPVLAIAPEPAPAEVADALSAAEAVTAAAAVADVVAAARDAEPAPAADAAEPAAAEQPAASDGPDTAPAAFAWAPEWPVAEDVSLAATSVAAADDTTSDVFAAEPDQNAAQALLTPEEDSGQTSETGWMGIAPALQIPPDYMIGPGTDALAFGWPQPGAQDVVLEDAAATQGESVEVAALDASPEVPMQVAARGDDPTDQFIPVDDFSSAADVGELVGASAYSIPEFADVLSDDAVADDAGDMGALVPAATLEALQEPGAGDPLLVFVADDAADPEQALSPDEVALAALTAAGAAEAGAQPSPAAEQIPGEAQADYEAHVSEEAHPDSGAPSAEQLRLVKRVRVVRRLMLNGQVVRETSAEQMVDADADTQQVAANLQHSLASADAETLQALAPQVDSSPSGGTQPAHAPDVDDMPPK